jgi:hypothetical protein
MPTKHQSYWDRQWKPLLVLLESRTAEVEAVANQPLGSKEQRLAIIELASLATIRERVISARGKPSK